VSSRRVVITGLGLISPVGNTVDSAWDAICNGRSGIGPITAFDVSELGTRIAGEIRDFEVTDYISGKEARRYDRFLHYGLVRNQYLLLHGSVPGPGRLSGYLPGGTVRARPSQPSAAIKSKLGVTASSRHVLLPRSSRGRPAAPSTINTQYFI